MKECRHGVPLDTDCYKCMEKEDAANGTEGLRLSGTDTDASVRRVFGRHDDCGDPGCCPDNSSLTGLVERLRNIEGGDFGDWCHLIQEAADALERMAEERRHLATLTEAQMLSENLSLKETIAALRTELEGNKKQVEFLERLRGALRAENERLMDAKVKAEYPLAMLDGEPSGTYGWAEGDVFYTLRKETRLVIDKDGVPVVDFTIWKAGAALETIAELRAENERLKVGSGLNMREQLDEIAALRAENERLRKACDLRHLGLEVERLRADNAAIKQARSEAIEECAGVAENWSVADRLDWNTPERIAAVIRALKGGKE